MHESSMHLDVEIADLHDLLFPTVELIQPEMNPRFFFCIWKNLIPLIKRETRIKSEIKIMKLGI